MPPSNCLASSSRSSHSAAIFRNPLTADGLSRRTTSLLERSAGWSHPNPVRDRLIVGIQYSRILQLRNIIHTIMDRGKILHPHQIRLGNLTWPPKTSPSTR